MKVSHRPEIDGLRAIAVTAIILYHAQITLSDHQLFKGGFIGIDLFFVISGYLITSIILKELVATGTFSFKNFYESRIRRLLPALLFVIIVSLPFAWVYLMPSSLINFAKSILYSLGFISNFYFHFSEQQIFAESALLKPFIHTWSLSLLQQFYILFPIVLFFTYKDFKKHILTILVICLILSWQIADFANQYNYSSASFSFLLTRMWELLIGSILAYFEIIKGHRSKNKILNLILPSIGLFLIGNFILLYRGTIPYTSFDTLQPIIGVCLIIWFSNKDELITKVLSTKLFVGVGLISYSLYLWHYPIYAFDRIIEFTEGSFFSELILVLIIIATSTFSYYFVERPFKNKKSKFKIITSLIIICVSTLVIVNLNFIKKNGHKNRFYISNIYQLDRQNYWGDLMRFETNFNYNNYDHRKNAIIVGNSHATDTLNILSRTNYKKKIYFNGASPKMLREETSNFQITELYEMLIKKKEFTEFKKGNFFNNFKEQYDNADLIILSSQYSNNDLDILGNLIEILKNDNKKIIIFDNALNQTMRAGFNRLDYYVYRNKKLPNKDILKMIEKDMFLDLGNMKKVNKKIELIAKKNDVFLIKREKIFCNFNQKSCPSLTEEGYKIYWDYGHITDKGAEFFAKIIENDELFLKYLNSILRQTSH